MESGIEILEDSSNIIAEAKQADTPAPEEQKDSPTMEAEKDAQDESPLAKVPKLENESKDDSILAPTANQSEPSAESDATSMDKLTLKQEVGQILAQPKEKLPKSEPSASAGKEGSSGCSEVSADSGVGSGVGTSLEIKQEMMDPNPRLFDGIKFYSIESSEETVRMLTEFGAVKEPVLSKGVTHVIAGKSNNFVTFDEKRVFGIFHKSFPCSVLLISVD